MKDFKQVRKLILSNLKDLDEELGEITNDKNQLPHSGSHKNEPDRENSKNTYVIIKESTVNELKKINHAITQISGKNNADF